MRVRDFLKANGLKQRELATYLEITEAAVSNVVKGKSDFSKENLIKILNNPYGWDTSMLVDQPVVPAPEQSASNNSLLEYLQRKIAELEGKIDKLNEEKADLLQENAVLRYENSMLTPRKGDAEDAASSLSASAV